MTDLERFRQWVQSYEGFPPEYQIDFSSEIPNTGTAFPNGLVEVSRTEDIMGNTTVHNQYNFAIYATFPKSEDGTAANVDAGWAMDFQNWVQAQSVQRLATTFGNIDTGKETITAQNGQYFENPATGLGQYQILVNANFKKSIGE